MLQSIQYQKTGELSVKELPAPKVRRGSILVRTEASLISAGTERTSISTAQSSMLEKARTRPDLVKQVFDMAKREGLWSTLEKVRSKLDSYKTQGYSASGVVVESGCDEFAVGDRVACAGSGGNHAEINIVPKNLAIKIPDEVSFEDASFTTLGSIALQGVRQAKINLGANVAVVGLGLIGQITVQLLKAAGCRVIGFDINKKQFDLAKEFGADFVALSDENSVALAESFSRGVGLDAVIITTSTSSNAPMEFALNATRKKGRIVVVGVTGMNIPRSPFYEKELEITISCSYGPGRYDSTYEEDGNDYPVAYVRWTEKRNMEAIIDLIAQKKLNVQRIITHRIPITEAEKAYDLITGKIDEAYLGIILQYPNRGELATARSVWIGSHGKPIHSGFVGIGFIGAGSFAQSYLLPTVKKSGARLVAVNTSTPVNARSVAEKYGFEIAVTDASEVLNNSNISGVFIATRHDSHGRYVKNALELGKQVFVEKPLCISYQELEEIRVIAELKNDRVMVGFNRRFSDPLIDMKNHFSNCIEPFTMTYRVNAGFLKLEFWTQHELQGGRIIGEGCHFIDCMQYICGARPISVYANCISSSNSQVKNNDTVSMIIKFSDGSIGNLIYLANGDPSVSKEYFEVFGSGRTAIMDNFKSLKLYKDRKIKEKKYNGDKGHANEVYKTLYAMRNGSPMPIEFDSLYNTTLITIAAMESLATGAVITL